MHPLRRALRRSTLWFGLAAFAVPLVALMVLQLRSLSTLQRTWTLAHRSSVEAFLEDVAEEVEQHFGKLGDAVLRIPPEALRPGQLCLAADHFAKAPREGVRGLYVFRLHGDGEGTLHRFDATRGELVVAEKDESAEAVVSAMGYWRMLQAQAIPVDSSRLDPDERDPDHRLLLYPLTDLAWNVTGVAALELDPVSFKERVLPELLKKSLARHFSDEVLENLVVTVHGPRGEQVYATADVEGQRDELAGRLRFVFRDWKVGVRSRHSTPEQFARSNFQLNVGIALALAALLVTGVTLTLRTASREVRLSKMKSDFVSNVSHELRTPLASIRLFGELMGSGRVSEPEKVREYGEFIDAESRRLTQLITNILDFSRIESGKKTYRQERVELVGLLDEVLKSFEVLLKHQGFAVKRSQEVSSLEVEADRDALGLVLHNLVDNAVKYSRSTKALAVRIARERDGAVIAIEDQGIGIPVEDQEKIFERFHRVSTGLVHEVRGSGLGLSIVRHVIEAHGGEVTVRSEVGKGSAFTLWLPLARTASPAEAEADAASEEAAASAPEAGTEEAAPSARSRPVASKEEGGARASAVPRERRGASAPGPRDLPEARPVSPSPGEEPS
jgi:signal transduction histidine kinase